jgi:hypothetical protein
MHLQIKLCITLETARSFVYQAISSFQSYDNFLVNMVLVETCLAALL